LLGFIKSFLAPKSVMAPAAPATPSLMDAEMGSGPAVAPAAAPPPPSMTQAKGKLIPFAEATTKDVLKAVPEALDAGATRMALEAGRWGNIMAGDNTAARSYEPLLAQQVKDELALKAKTMSPDSTESNIAKAAQALPQSLAYMGAFALGGAPAAALVSQPQTVDSYKKFRELGNSPLASFVGAQGGVAAEVVPEMISWKLLTNIFKLPTGSSKTEFLKAIGLQQVGEHSEEQITNVANFVIDRVMNDPTATPERLLKDAKETFGVTAILSPLMAGGAVAARAVPGAASAIVDKVSPQTAIAREFQSMIDNGPIADAPILSERRAIPGAVRPAPKPPVAPVDQTAIAKQVMDEIGMSEEDLAAAINGDQLPADEIPPLAQAAPRLKLFPDLTGGINPVAGFVSEEDAIGRLSRAVNRDDENVAQPKNERTVLKDAMGEFVVGKVTPDDWLKRVEANVPKEEFANARNWYRQLHDTLTPIYGEDAPKVALAWLLSQQRASPSKGMQDVLRAFDNVKGKTTLQPGLNADALRSVLRGELPKSGLGAKLLDFIDAELGLPTRTVMGRDPRGGQPAPFDIWGIRDSGLVDESSLKRLKERFGAQAEKLNVDAINASSDSYYERGNRFYNDLAKHLNKIKFDGGNWTAREAQAVGWVAIQKAMGETPEYVSDIIGKNTRRVSLGLLPGTGSALPEDHPMFKPERAQRVVEELAEAAGIKILRATPGQGAYQTFTEGAIQIDAFASPESVRDFIDMLGYTFQQSAVIATRALKSGKQHGFDIVFADEAAGRENEFFQAMREFTTDGEVDLAPGYQQINIDGKAGIRLLNFGGHWKATEIEHLSTAVAFASNQTGIPVSETVDFNVQLESTENDWTNQKSGEAYSASLRNRGRLQEAAAMERIARAAQDGAAPLARQTDEQSVVNPIDLDASVEDQLRQIAALTAENRPIIDALIKRAGLEGDSNIKTDEAIVGKATRPTLLAAKPWFTVAHVRDTLRFKMILDSMSDLDAVAKELNQSGLQMIKVDVEKALNPGKWGWRIVAVDMRMPNGQIVEGYFPVRELEVAKKTVGHEIFERWRNRDIMALDAAEMTAFERDVKKSRETYDEAWRAAQARSGEDDSAVRAAISRFFASLSDTGIKSSSSSAPVTGGALAQTSPSRMARNSPSTTSTLPSRDDIANIDKSPSGNSDTEKPLKFKTGTGASFGITGKYGNAFVPLDGPNLKMVRFALDALVEQGALSREIVESIDGFAGYDMKTATHQALYVPQGNVVGVNTDYLRILPQPMLQRMLAHEIGHAVDHNGGVTTSASAASPRLDFEVNDQGIVARGDLSEEIVRAANSSIEMRIHFAYPIDTLLDGMMEVPEGKSEMLAQVSALYAESPDTVRRLMPKWHAIMEATYGQSENKGGVQSAIARSYRTLRDALQDKGADERVSGSVIPNSLALGTAGQGQPGTPRGPPGVGVGAGASGGTRNPGGTTPGGANPRQPANVRWDIDEPGLRDTLTREWQDKVVDVKRVQEAIQRYGGVIRERGNAYLAEELYHGRVSARIKAFTDNVVKPLLEDIRKSGLSVEQVGNYLWARHAPERNKQMARINPQGGLNLSGLYDNARVAAAAGAQGAPNAADIMAGFTPDQMRALNGIAARIDAMTKATRDIIINANLEDPAVIRAWEGAYKHYVPLYRDVDEAGAAQGFQVTGPESKRAMGSTKEAVSIVAAVIAQHEKAIIRSEKAEVARSLVRLAEQFPNPRFWRVDQPPTKRTINPTTGLVQVGTDPMYRQRDDVLVVKDKDANGDIVERVITFNPRSERAMKLAAAMRNLDVVQLDGVTKVVGKVSRIMASLVTSWNPLFWTTNFARDVQTAAVNLQSTALTGQAPKVMSNIMPAMAGIASAEFRNGGGKWARLYREFEQNGGKTGWMKLFDDLIDRNNELEAEIKNSQRSKVNPIRWAKLTIDVIDSANAVVENATRLSAYSAALDHGLTPKAAASLAKNLTVNFNRKGNRGTAVNAWYMFFNASVQGTARMISGVAKSRRAQLIVGTMVAFGAALELINRLIGDDDRDEDGNNPYEMLPEYIKQKNMVFMLPGGKRATIPLPYGFNTFHNAGRMMMEAVLTASNSDLIDERKKPGEMAWNFAEVLVDSFMPFGQTSSPAQLISPTVLDPVVQHAENKTWFGSPMRPEPLPFGPAKPDHQLYFRSTSDTAKDLAKWLSDMSGGDDVRGGAIDISPTTLVHIFRTITGGSGSFALGMFDFTSHVVGRATGERESEDMPWKNVPFVGKFYGEVDDRDMASKYYRLREKAIKVFGQYETYRKSGDPDGMERIEQETPELVAMGREINSRQFKREMTSVRKDFEATRELSGTEQQRARRALQAEEVTIMSRAMRAYNDAITESRP
jgi:hypothetical protein